MRSADALTITRAKQRGKAVRHHDDTGGANARSHGSIGGKWDWRERRAIQILDCNSMNLIEPRGFRIQFQQLSKAQAVRCDVRKVIADMSGEIE